MIVNVCVAIIAAEDNADGKPQIIGLFSKKFEMEFAPYPPTVLERWVDSVMFEFTVEQLRHSEPGSTTSFMGGTTAHTTHRVTGILSKQRFDNDPSWKNMLKGRR